MGEISIDVRVDEDENVIRYNLAFIHHEFCKVDNGRALGYDNAHGVHERHWIGHAEVVEHIDYDKTLAQFHNEIDRLSEEL